MGLSSAILFRLGPEEPKFSTRSEDQGQALPDSQLLLRDLGCQTFCGH